MLGVTVPDIHRSLDKAAQATMIPAARVRGIYIDAARLEAIRASPGDSGDWGRREGDCDGGARVQGERKATLSASATLPSRPSSHGFGEHPSAFFGETGLLAQGQSGSRRRADAGGPEYSRRH